MPPSVDKKAEADL